MTVSVIIPTYNRSNILKRTVDSVLNQNYSDFEVIVVNDGSDDNTSEIINSYNDPRITLYEQENKGLSAARNKGIKMSEGKYIAFIDDDDEYFTNFLQVAVEELENESSSCGAIFSPFVKVKCGSQSSIRRNDYNIVNKQNLLEGNYPHTSGSGTIYRREVFENVGYFDESFPFFVDREFWTRVTLNDYYYKSLPEPFIKRHTHRNDRMGKQSEKIITAYIKYINQYEELMVPNYLAYRKYKLVRELIRTGESIQAIRYLRELLSDDKISRLIKLKYSVKTSNFFLKYRINKTMRK